LRFSLLESGGGDAAHEFAGLLDYQYQQSVNPKIGQIATTP
jgi:hypothetical protein